MKVENDQLKEIMLKINNKMSEIYGIKLNKIILYGSYARQEQTDESDIDIMVLVDEEPINLKNYDNAIVDFEVEMNLEYDIVLSIYPKCLKEYKKYIEVLPFLKNIRVEGKVYYG